LIFQSIIWLINIKQI